MEETDSKGEGVKKRVSISHADSTQPVNEILKYFERSNRKAHYNYCELLGRRKSNLNRHNLYVGHPLNTFQDDWDGMLPTGYFEKFSYKSSYPKIITPMKNIGCIDPVTQLMNLKMWIQRRIPSAGNPGKPVQMLKEDVALCARIHIEQAIVTENNPDPYFNSTYNWYYTGHGNLHVIYLAGSDYILHSELNYLYLSKFSKEQLSIDQNHIFKYDCGEENYILETIHVDNNFIALRLKHRVIILKMYILGDSIKVEQVQELENELPFTSISFDPYHKNILYITTLDNTVYIVNLTMMKRRTVKLTETEDYENNWSSVIGCSTTTYGHVSRKAVRIYDKRTNSIVQTWDGVEKVSDFSCNHISIAKMCDEIPFMYVGTDHHLFLVDTRCFGKNKPVPVQRWTHNMECLPTSISLCKFEVNKELLCFSSQLAFEDMRILQNYSDCFNKELQVTSISMPFSPPTLEYTLNMARLNKLCLDIYNPLEKRIFNSATGNAIVECGETYLVLTQNSLGDIFCHTLYPDHMTFEDNGLELLHEWGKSHKGESKTIDISKMIDIAPVWQSLKKIPKSHTFGDEKLFPNEEYNFSEQEIVNTFESGKLDSGLLDIWMEDEDEKKCIRPETLAIDLHFSDSE